MSGQTSTNNDEHINQKVKIKDHLSTEELKTLLSTWLKALEENEDFSFVLQGHEGYIPKEILQNGTTEGEFEFKNGFYEFELELKWKEGSEKKSSNKEFIRPS